MKRTKGQVNKKKKITPQSAKAKGRKLQTWVCEQISKLTGYEWGTSGDDKPIESRPMGQSGPDIRKESQVKQVFPYSVECKWQEKWDVPGWIKQARENCPDDEDWILFLRRSYMKDPYTVIVMDAEKFFEILTELNR